MLHAPVLDGLTDMGGGNLFLSFQIGNGAGNFDYPVVGSGGEAETVHGLMQQTAVVINKMTTAFYQSLFHLAVAVDERIIGKTTALDGAVPIDPFSDCFGTLARLGPFNIFNPYRWYLHLDVYAVKQWPGQTVAIPLDLYLTADTFLVRITVESASSNTGA